MARISIYIPDDLKKLMDKAPSVNWSDVCQKEIVLTLIKKGLINAKQG